MRFEPAIINAAGEHVTIQPTSLMNDNIIRVYIQTDTDIYK